MAVWGTIGNTLKTGAQKMGGAIKTGTQKVGGTLGQTTQKLPNIDDLTFDPANKPLPNIDDLTFDPNKKPPVNIDDLTFENMLNGGEPEQQRQRQTGQSGLANALAQNDYQFTPSMVDYSQFMGLSPETQRYLYGGL